VHVRHNVAPAEDRTEQLFEIAQRLTWARRVGRFRYRLANGTVAWSILQHFQSARGGLPW